MHNLVFSQICSKHASPIIEIVTFFCWVIYWTMDFFSPIIRNKLWEVAENTGLPTFVVADAGRTQVTFCAL